MFPGYGEWDVLKAVSGTGETLPGRKAVPISLRAKWQGAGRESEQGIVPEGRDSTTLPSPKGQGKALCLILRFFEHEVSARA